MQDTGFCQFLEWDSKFFDRRIARLIPSRLAPDLIPAVFDWCRMNRIDCLYFLADAGHGQTAQLASAHGFALVDVRVTFEHCPSCSRLQPPQAGELAIRPYRPDDLRALRTMAARLHEDSRFFFDDHFPQPRSRAMFEIWIEKSCCNVEGKVFVVEFQGKPAGYIACRCADGHSGHIDLLGVDGAARGRKAGTGLVRRGLEWFEARGVTPISVVTQGRNIQAQRLYQKCGFLTASVQLWYHRWFEPTASERQA